MGDGAGRLRWGLVLASAAVLFAVLVRLVGMPLHAAGYGQPVLGYLNGLGWVLQTPGSTAAYLLRLSSSPYTRGTWVAGLALNVPFYFLVGLFARSVWLLVRPSPAPAAVPLPARRRFLKTGVRLLGAGAVAGIGYAFVEPRWFGVTRRPSPCAACRPPSTACAWCN